MSEQDINQTQTGDERETVDAIAQSTRNKGGRPRLPDAPTNSEECRALISLEAVKTSPSPTRSRLLTAALESFERQEEQGHAEREREFAQSQADNAALKQELESVRGLLQASQEKCESLIVPATKFEELKANFEAQTRLAQALSRELITAKAACDAAVASRDLAISAQRTAEQNEAHVKQHLGSEYIKLIEPLSAALRSLTGISGIDAREKRYVFERLLEEFRRLHAQAMSAPAPFTPMPVKAVRAANPEELAKAVEAKIEADRIENAEQPRSAEPSGFEHFREKAVPRIFEPEPSKPISGGADFADWVK